MEDCFLMSISIISSTLEKSIKRNKQVYPNLINLKKDSVQFLKENRSLKTELYLSLKWRMIFLASAQKIKIEARLGAR